MKRINKLSLMALIMLLTGFNLTISMEQQSNTEPQVQKFGKLGQKEYEAKENYMLNMPNEMLLNIIEEVIRSHMSKWTDIFNFDEEFDKADFNQDMTNLLAACKRFKFFKDDIIRSIKRIKAERFEYLKDQIKRQNKLSKGELNKKISKILSPEGTKLIPEEKLQEAIKLVLAGADVDIKSDYGYTLLTFVVMGGYIDLVKLLISIGANVNPQTEHGDTALIQAARSGNVDMVKLLIGANADVNLKNDLDYTALDEAEFRRYSEIVQLLKEAGAQR